MEFTERMCVEVSEHVINGEYLPTKLVNHQFGVPRKQAPGTDEHACCD